MTVEMTLQAAAKLLPKRDDNAHKGDFGRVLLLAGSVGMAGAAIFAARAAVRGGAGLTYLAVPPELYAIAAAVCPEVMTFPLDAPTATAQTPPNERLFELLERCDVFAAGPGLGTSATTIALLERILKYCQTLSNTVILDADALNFTARHIDMLSRLNGRAVLTPHEGEFARLAPDLRGSREARATAFAVRHGVTLVLKGQRTVTASADGSAVVNTTGNAGMAKGGSGDVLTGLTAALAGQLPLNDAVPLAVYLHGLAGDIAKQRFGEHSMLPSDLIDALPAAFLKLEKERDSE
jgi:NAD(P)H-hydrate epimerase